MCGFIASFGQNAMYEDFEKAMHHLKRRGPDSEGVWSNESVFLGSRRLAIFDLNERSNQPMQSLCSRFLIVFNGSIYNYKDLRKYLLNSGIKLKTFSDTEVILELFVLEGPKMLNRLKGMFAFVIWDDQRKEAFAARDPYGIKPLYIGTNSQGLILASQVKTLISTGKFKTDKDIYSEFSFENFGYIVEPRTWFKNIRSLEAGHYVIIRNNKIQNKKKWFQIENLWISADEKNKKLTSSEKFDEIKKALKETVKKHLVSDVPIGIFLSGGLDSSLLALLVSMNTKENIKAITVLFEDYENTEYDETYIAKKVSEKYGLNHHIYKVTKKDFFNDLPEILDSMDQPSIDGINTWYASKAASKLKLKVVFSGLGGDEIFFGYDHYKKISFLFNFLKVIKKIPLATNLMSVILNAISIVKGDKRWKFIVKHSNSILKLWFLKRSILFSNKNKILNGKKNNLSISDFYKENLNEKFEYNFKNSKINMSLLDSMFYLRNQLLRDSDWASMYHGIELRTPFVDTELIENLKNIMNNYSIHENKEVIKLTFKSLLPHEVLSKKKVGFQTPIVKWYHDYFKVKNQSSRNYIYNYINDIKESFNKL